MQAERPVSRRRRQSPPPEDGVLQHTRRVRPLRKCPPEELFFLCSHLCAIVV